jgi:cytochrome c biogenesis protein ResB
VQKLYRFLKSVKLAVVLIAWLAATGILSTLVPQGREPGFYLEVYHGLAGRLILASGFSRFFTSVLFLVPAGLFFVNLGVCTVDRFLREVRRPSRRRHGPDILHVGLLVLVVGAVLSFAGRQTGFVRLAKGDGVEMPGGRLLVLDDFSYTTYDDGRPRDWTSTVRVAREGRDEVPPFPIRVNHPLRLGRMSIYQVSHSVETLLAVTDPAGRDHLLAEGEEATHGGATLFFMARPQEGGQVVVRVQSAGDAEVLRLSAGDSAGGFSVQGLRDVDITGLEAVIDPGYPVVLAGLGLILVGLAVTFIGKTGVARS